MADALVRLEADGWTCVVAPERGGAILSLAHRGWDVFRPAAEGETHPFRLSSFVMAPYANAPPTARSFGTARACACRRKSTTRSILCTAQRSLRPGR